MLRTSRTGLVLAGAIALSACGGGTTPTPIPSPTPTPLITETIVIYGDNGSFPPETVGYTVLDPQRGHGRSHGGLDVRFQHGGHSHDDGRLRRR